MPGRYTTLEYGRARACYACSSCGIGGLFFPLSSLLSYFPFLMSHLLKDGMTF